MTMTTTELPEAVVPSGGMRSAWEGHERQYPRTGDPGIRYWRGRVNIGDVTSSAANAIIGRVWYEPDCLLYRSRKGTLVGVLQYFPEPAPMDLERRGAVNVFVHLRRQRRGIALALVAEADRRWAIDWQDQKYTPEGRALLEHYLRGAG
jgi:GNAT superfamily N-acetyltransferase